jgi:intracellular sulfur oxidation DsrE/DsrF family protein
LATGEAAQNKVVLHLASADPERLRGVLDDAERLLSGTPADERPLQLEVVTNDGGLALLRADVSPYAERIRAMRAAHRELHFIACNQGLEKLRKAGLQVRLLPDAEVAPSALDQIATRLRQGCTHRFEPESRSVVPCMRATVAGSAGAAVHASSLHADCWRLCWRTKF